METWKYSSETLLCENENSKVKNHSEAYFKVEI